ncbi:MAG: hypothetical protein IPJ32_01745 [Sphingobacteriaceae bacterium]|nr:hypothetical protein [Sphingobacteriaceae bacterium]
MAKAKALDSLFNASNIHNANTSFNDDFTKIFVSRCNAVTTVDYSCQIYFSQYIDGKWTVLKPLPPPINIYQSNNTQPNVSKLNGKDVLFFSSTRKGGEGGFDIWYSTFDNDLNFGTPINAGKKINSTEDEITPWFVKKIIRYTLVALGLKVWVVLIFLKVNLKTANLPNLKTKVIQLTVATMIFIIV